MEDKLREIVARIAETSANFSLQAQLRDDLNVDSYRAVEILFEVEREFGIEVPGSRYHEVGTFNDLVKLVASIRG